jgi:hypothetical protein
MANQHIEDIPTLIQSIHHIRHEKQSFNKKKNRNNILSIIEK